MTIKHPSASIRPLRSFGRIKARALKPRQQDLVDALLPHLAVDVGAPLALRDMFPAAERFVLEIGFGAGEHLAAQASAHPTWGLIGVEPFLNGMGSCLRHIEEQGITNVRLHLGDARDVISHLPPASLARVYILFPDPWPKARHWKRRLVQAEFVADLARVVKPAGEVRFATDWAHYAAWTLETFLKNEAFAWTAGEAADWRMPWVDHVTTRYESKNMGDCKPVFLQFRRVEAK
jgi:tRNA (guanine-N7-)-methyltransferase